MKREIRFKISSLLKKYRLSQRQVALECNIRPATMKLYVDNMVQRINVLDLLNLYNFFYELDDRIKLSDLMDVEDIPSMSEMITIINNSLSSKKD